MGENTLSKRIVEKILLPGVIVCSITTLTGLGGAAIDKGGRLLNEDKLKDYLNSKGYIQVNEDYKKKQIQKAIDDYTLGIISVDELSLRINKEKITELDIDTFAKENLSKEDYNKYLSLKQSCEDSPSQTVTAALAMAGLLGMAILGTTYVCDKNLHKETL